MTSIPCPHCGRQISDQSKRCLYCAKPLATDAVGDDAEKRARMLRAMYEAGVGLPTPEKQSWFERQRDEPVLVRQANVVAGTFHPELTRGRGLHRFLAGLASQQAAGVPVDAAAPGA